MKAYQVSEVNKYIKEKLSSDVILSNISVEGEISNYVHHSSGHMYFTLKDQTSRLKSVMFKWDNKKISMDLEDGMKIIAKGSISVYDRDGVYQLYVKEITDAGLGELYKKFEELKKKLKEEGFFNEENKKPLPKIPKKIGIVTSPTGAAIKDIISIIERRFPPTNILIYPALVQGKDASKTIIEGLEYLDKREDVDIIIFGRGGGSTEELFAFNDEALARTIYSLKKPTISAVGHQIDFTIGDFVADVRAATPSAAAEIAVPEIRAYSERLYSIYLDIFKKIDKSLEKKSQTLQLRKKEISYFNPEKQLADKLQYIDSLYDSYSNNLLKLIQDRVEGLLKLNNRLILTNPRLGLEQGYSIVTNKLGKKMASIKDIDIEDTLYLEMIDGRVIVEVKEKKEV